MSGTALPLVYWLYWGTQAVQGVLWDTIRGTGGKSWVPATPRINQSEQHSVSSI